MIVNTETGEVLEQVVSPVCTRRHVEHRRTFLERFDEKTLQYLVIGGALLVLLTS